MFRIICVILFLNFWFLFAQKDWRLALSYFSFILFLMFVFHYSGSSYQQQTTDWEMLEMQVIERFFIFMAFSFLFASQIVIQFLALNFEIHLSNAGISFEWIICGFVIVALVICSILYRQALLFTFCLILAIAGVFRLLQGGFFLALNSFFLNETALAFVTTEQLVCFLFFVLSILTLIIMLIFFFFGTRLQPFLRSYYNGLLRLRISHFILLFLVLSFYTLLSYASIDLLPEVLTGFLFSLEVEPQNCTSLLCKRSLLANGTFINKQFTRQIFFHITPTAKTYYKNMYKLTDTAPINHPLYSPIKVLPPTGTIEVTPMTRTPMVDGQDTIRISKKETIMQSSSIKPQYMVPKRFTMDVAVLKKDFPPMDSQQAIQYEKKYNSELKDGFVRSQLVDKDILQTKK